MTTVINGDGNTERAVKGLQTFDIDGKGDHLIVGKDNAKVVVQHKNGDGSTYFAGSFSDIEIKGTWG